MHQVIKPRGYKKFFLKIKLWPLQVKANASLVIKKFDFYHYDASVYFNSRGHGQNNLFLNFIPYFSAIHSSFSMKLLWVFIRPLLLVRKYANLGVCKQLCVIGDIFDNEWNLPSSGVVGNHCKNLSICLSLSIAMSL